MLLCATYLFQYEVPWIADTIFKRLSESFQVWVGSNKHIDEELFGDKQQEDYKLLNY